MLISRNSFKLSHGTVVQATYFGVVPATGSLRAEMRLAKVPTTYIPTSTSLSDPFVFSGSKASLVEGSSPTQNKPGASVNFCTTHIMPSSPTHALVHTDSALHALHRPMSLHPMDFSSQLGALELCAVTVNRSSRCFSLSPLLTFFRGRQRDRKEIMAERFQSLSLPARTMNPRQADAFPFR